jgi:hypothetical protein
MSEDNTPRRRKAVRFGEPEVVGQAQVLDRSWRGPSQRSTAWLVNSPEFAVIHQKRIEARLTSNQWGTELPAETADSAPRSRSRSSSAPASLLSAQRMRSAATADGKRRRCACGGRSATRRFEKQLSLATAPLLLLPMVLSSATTLPPLERFFWTSCFAAALLEYGFASLSALAASVGFTVHLTLLFVFILPPLSAAAPALAIACVVVACVELASPNVDGFNGVLLNAVLRLLCAASVFCRTST